MAPILGYWERRAFSEPIRLTLAQAGQEYELRLYKIGPAPDFDQSDWLNEKFKLGLDYPNLPYFIDGDVKLTQLLAILRYLAKKHDLGPKSAGETIRSDIGEQAIMEILLACFDAWYAEEELYESSKALLLDYLPSKLEQTIQFLGNGKFILGDRVTYVDFLLYSALDYIRCFQSSIIDNLKPLKDYLTRIEALPEIKKYLKSGNYRRFPIAGPMATFGGQQE